MLKHEDLMFADEYTVVGKFIEGRAIVKFNEPYKKKTLLVGELDTFGFIEPSGAIITKDRYERVWNFCNGLAVVRHYETVYIVIDLYGNELAKAMFPPHFKIFEDELIAIKTEQGRYYIIPAVKTTLASELVSPLL